MKLPSFLTSCPPGRWLALFVLAGSIGLVSQANAFIDKLPVDPVEEFHKALQLEKADPLEARLEGKAKKFALDFRKKNLQRAADNLKSLSDIAQALLLIWPVEDAPGYQEEAREIDNQIRDKLIKRLVDGIRKAFRDAPPSRQAAIAILLGETALASATDIAPADPKARPRGDGGRENLFRELSKLTPDLAKLTNSPSPHVRGAAARALGQFPKRPYTVACALDGVLVKDRDHVLNRRAAAQSLVTLVQTVTGTEPLPPSEPGIMTRETRRNKRLFAQKEIVGVWAAVAPVAARGLADPDTRVRRVSASALHQAVTALAQDIYLASRDPVLKNFPPRERKDLAPDEKERIRQGKKEIIDKYEEQIKPVLAALTGDRPVCGCNVPQALANAAADPDIEVRLGVRRTLHEMARARHFLYAFRDALPPIEPEKKGKDAPEKLDKPKEGDKDKKEKKKDPDLSRRSGSSAIQLVSNDLPILQLPPPPNRALQKDKAKNDEAKKEEEDKAKKDKDEDEDPYKKAKVDPDALGRTLVFLGQEIIRRGAIDSNAAGRRASLEAVESLGETGAVFLPQLVKALKDPDLFARWIASRALGKLAPAKADDVVPALVCLLDDDDLDVRVSAAEAIGLYNSSAACAVPALAARVNTGDAEFRLAVLKALENIGLRAAPALPALAPLLSNIDPRLRAEAARVIGRFGTLSAGYLPALRAMLRDPDSEVRRSASAAIISITDE